MLWSELSIQTLREGNHPLLARAGYLRGNEYLPLGQRSLAKIAAIVREENHFGPALERCGVTFVQAGDAFLAESPSGLETLVSGAGYDALLDHAVGIPTPPAAPDPAGDLTPEEFHTPGIRTIAQLAEFTGLPVTSQIKSLVLVRNGAPLLLLLRGDHQFNPAKLPGARQADAGEIRSWFGADPGSLGPLGTHNIPTLADEALRGRRNMIAGANKNDYHLRHVTPGEDFETAFSVVRRITLDDTCIHGGVLVFSKAALLASAEAILAAAVEQHADKDGMVLPASIAPFTLIITPLHPDRLQPAREIYNNLVAAGVEVLLDDRDVRPGVKFKDADLIGIPYRITVGKKFAEGWVELVDRATHQATDVAPESLHIPR